MSCFGPIKWSGQFYIYYRYEVADIASRKIEYTVCARMEGKYDVGPDLLWVLESSRGTGFRHRLSSHGFAERFVHLELLHGGILLCTTLKAGMKILLIFRHLPAQNLVVLDRMLSAAKGDMARTQMMPRLAWDEQVVHRPTGVIKLVANVLFVPALDRRATGRDATIRSWYPLHRQFVEEQ